MVSTMPVGETPTQISLPPVCAVLVLNSSGGLGDSPGPDIIVDNGADCSLDPQVGIRLAPGEFFTFPLRNPSNGHQLPLYAVASGPGGTVELELVTDDE